MCYRCGKYLSESRYIDCTDRIGHYEFEITKDDVKYAVILQQDTYEWNIQLTVQIGYKTPADKEKLQNEYDTFWKNINYVLKKVWLEIGTNAFG